MYRRLSSLRLLDRSFGMPTSSAGLTACGRTAAQLWAMALPHDVR